MYDLSVRSRERTFRIGINPGSFGFLSRTMIPVVSTRNCLLEDSSTWGNAETVAVIGLADSHHGVPACDADGTELPHSRRATVAASSVRSAEHAERQRSAAAASCGNKHYAYLGMGKQLKR